jgi:hypothetical protein
MRGSSSSNTTGKRHSFVGFFIFVPTDEYIRIIIVGLGPTSTNIWVIRFDLDWPHIFIGGVAYISQWPTYIHRFAMNIGDRYSLDHFPYAPTVAAALGNFCVSRSRLPPRLLLTCLACHAAPTVCLQHSRCHVAHLPRLSRRRSTTYAGPLPHHRHAARPPPPRRSPAARPPPRYLVATVAELDGSSPGASHRSAAVAARSLAPSLPQW